MDLVTGSPYWLLRNGLIANYPPLTEALECDVAVLGAGISGALIAWRLAQAGMNVAVLDKRDVATGSSVASTGLVQYEIDTPLRQLALRIGELNAVRAYRLCRNAVLTLERVDRELGGQTGMRHTGSLQGASHPRHVAGLKTEYELRRHHGFQVEWWNRRDLERETTLPFPAALLTNEAAQVDTHRLTHAFLRAGTRLGVRIFDRTRVTGRKIRPSQVRLQTDRGRTVTAKHLVIATGYETGPHISPRLTRLISTFAVVSEPCPKFTGWPGARLIWETARPYTYLAQTDDRRLLIGGGDVASNDPDRRAALQIKKAAQLGRRCETWLPEIPFEAAFSWAATFAETPDGLPYIGRHPNAPHTYYALGYGGNGILFSVVAAEILRDLICTGTSPDADLFSFERVLNRRS